MIIEIHIENHKTAYKISLCLLLASARQIMGVIFEAVTGLEIDGKIIHLHLLPSPIKSTKIPSMPMTNSCIHLHHKLISNLKIENGYNESKTLPRHLSSIPKCFF